MRPWSENGILEDVRGSVVIVAGKRVGRGRMFTSQVTSESLGRLPGVGSWLCAGKNSRASHSKVEEGLFREMHTP